MAWHTVEAGECLSQIAADYGFYEWETIYYASENDSFRQQRPNPNVIYPGDEIFIPDLTARAETCETDKVHRFLRKSGSYLLRLKMVDDLGEALVGYPFKLKIGRDVVADVTRKKGLIEVSIPVEARSGELQFLGETYEVRFGILDPPVRTTGIQQRLNNLGYVSGPVDGILGPLTASALHRFQSEHDELEPSGRVDKDTWELLEKLHDGVARHTPKFEDAES